MKGAILAILLMLGTCLIIPTGCANNNVKENTANEPIWGKTYSSAYSSGPEFFIYYAFFLHTNDSLTINATISGTVQIWFGGYNSQPNLYYSLPTIIFNSSSNDTVASNGLIDDTMDFWLISSVNQMMTIIVRHYALGSIQYTINKINATDPITTVQNQINNLTMNMTNLTTELNVTKDRINQLNSQVNNLITNESLYYHKLTMMGQIIDQIIGQNIPELWTAIEKNNTILANQLVSNMTELSNQISLLNNTLNDRISNIKPYNDTPIWDELNNIKQPINATYLNQTLVNQTVVNTTEVRPVTYLNKTITNKSETNPLIAIVAGMLGGIISGFVIATILIRRQKPEIIYMKNIEPPEG
jgi:K+/H+ antiporter YhaU regulatory subunit KhtT